MMKPLYLRLDEALNAALRAEYSERQKHDPTVTIADIVREYLRAGLRKECPECRKAGRC